MELAGVVLGSFWDDAHLERQLGSHQKYDTFLKRIFLWKFTQLKTKSHCVQLNMVTNPILHGRGVKLTPPGWLLYANPRGMPRMDWFFMTLFLSILERSLVGHFWDFFLKFPKNFTSTIFSTYNPKGGPFYASVRTPFARNFFVLFLVKNGNNSTPNA